MVVWILVMAAQDTPTFFAHLLHKSMKGAGTDEDRLIRVVVSRAEVRMLAVSDTVSSLYGQNET